MAKPGFTTDYFTVDSGVVDGQTISKWTEDWWKWALNSPTDNNPFNGSGSMGANQNPGSPVFFVETTQSQDFTVSAGKALLIPLINLVDTAPEYLPPHGSGAVSNSDAIHSTQNAHIKAFDNGLSNLSATITPDGGSPISIPDLANYIVDSSFFDPGIAKAGTVAVDVLGVASPGQSMSPARSGGAWLMLDNLKPGGYTISVGGYNPGVPGQIGASNVAVTDHVTVAT
jgi:hypothetical protein